MKGMNRREFLQAAGLAGTSTVVGCSSETWRRLIPYLSPAEDVIPGEPEWYAATCRECPAGCGLLAKNRDGRIIKVEGNPSHPINAGRLCPRGQASLQGLYNPDRFHSPMQRNAAGVLEPVAWDKAEEKFLQTVGGILERGRGDRIVFMTELTTGTLNDLQNLWLKEMGQPAGHIIYEPLAYEPLKKANQIVFGFDGIPAYRLDQADFLISFNAGFLETWLSNVEYTRQFAAFHALNGGRRNPVVFVGPRLSMTAANADLWIPVDPGDEYLVALGIMKVILDENMVPSLDSNQRAALAGMIGPWTVETIGSKSGLNVALLRNLAHLFAKARKPLALAGGLPVQGPHATETAIAANLLCTLNPETAQTIDFGVTSAYASVAGMDAVKEVSERMKRGEVDLLLVHGANPVFSLPLSWDFRKSVQSVSAVVSFSSAVDETSALAHLVLPTHTPLESWGDYSPRTGVYGLMQPVMGQVFDTRHLGDILISTGKKLKKPDSFPWKDFYECLQESWNTRGQETAPDVSSDAFWQKALETGGVWKSGNPALQPLAKISQYSFPAPDKDGGTLEKGFHFTAYPTIQFFDGRGANKPWMQELPDPITQVTWGGWLEIHPDTAAELNIEVGDMLEVKSPFGTVEVPARPIQTVPPRTVAMPVGQGHTAYGRFADGLPADPLCLFPPEVDGFTGGMALPPQLTVSIRKTGTASTVAHTDGSFYQEGRNLLQFMGIKDYSEAVSSGRTPRLDMPLPQYYDPKVTFYPPHDHKDYRWSMVVDLDRCIGCGACAVACYAENNLAVVGKEQVIRGRVMSWLRLERYFDDNAPRAAWLPMFCQHCDCAPCESVCPMYAPHHNMEGMNVQIYNRCFGTRFCLQNDPYKVRRFNFYTYTHPDPLNLQLNPDVLVRQKGVMEKCSFCVQRVIDAKIKARLEDRKVKDGEFTTACAQTCPAGVFTFGSLMDPDSKVSRMIGDVRTYQVLMHLNTKPAVFYLKRVRQDVLTT